MRLVLKASHRRTAGITLVCLLLLFSSAESYAARTITPPTFGAGATSGPAVVATNGATFLTLWTLDTHLGGKHVYGSLADAAGTPLAVHSFLTIPHTSVTQLFASGNEYLALVIDRDGAGMLRTARLASDGRFLGFIGVLPTLSPTTFSPDAHAFNGSEILTVGSVNPNTPKAQTAAQVSRPDGSSVSAVFSLGGFTRFDVAASGTEFVVATAGNDGVFLRRLARDGNELTKVRLPVDRPESVISIAVSTIGDECAVAWTEQRLPDIFVHLATFSRSGEIIGQAVLPASAYFPLRLRSNSASYVLVNGDRLLRFDRKAQLMGTPVTAPSTADVVITDSILYLVTVGSYYSPQLVTAFPMPLDRPLAADRSFVVSTTLRRQVWPTLAADGAGFLAVWSDQAADSRRLMATRLDQNGAALDGVQIDLGTANAPADDLGGYYSTSARDANVVFGDQVYLAVWQQRNDVFMRRIDRSGNLLDSEPVLLQTNAYLSDHSLIWTGTAFVVSWSEAKGVRAAVVTEDGTISNRFDLHAEAPNLLWDGRQLIVAAIRYGGVGCTCTPVPLGLSLQRISLDGTPIDKAPIFLALPNSSFRIATSGHELVIASDVASYSGSGYYSYRIEVRSVRTDGPSLQISAPATVFQWLRPTVSELAWNGREYILSWRYGLGSSQWMGLTHLSSDLTSFDSRYVETVPDIYDRPSIGTTVAGADILAFSEIPSPGSPARIHTLSETDMKPTPPPPAAPSIQSAIGTPQSAVVTWKQPGGVEASGFIVDWYSRYANYAPVPVLFLPADARSATVTVTQQGFLVTSQDYYLRVRSFNAGGLSEPSAAMHVSLPLRNRR